MEKRSHLRDILIAGVFGILTAYAISTTLYRNDLTSPSAWSIALSLLTLGFGGPLFWLIPLARGKYVGMSKRVWGWGGILAVTSAVFFSLTLGIAFLVPLAITGGLLLSFVFPLLREILLENRTTRFLLAWSLSLPVSFFTLGFFNNFYPAFTHFLLFTALLTAFLTVLIERLSGHVLAALRINPVDRIIPLLVLMLGISLLILTVWTLLQYPDYFSLSFFLPDQQLLPVFFGTAILSQGLAAFLGHKQEQPGGQAATLLEWTKANLPGLLLAFTVAASTYLLATALVSDEIIFLDIFFQMDSPWWVNFLTLEADRILPMRFVHPFVLLILRPPVWLISLFLNGDKFQAALLLNNIVGGLCVFLAWLFFKKQTGNTAYALLMAALLGFSNAHLALSTFLESYIFSAAALISFILLLQSRESRFSHHVLAGLITFGITITNFIQTCIGLLVMRRDIKFFFKYGVSVLALATTLAFVQHIFYPTSDPIYLTNRYKSEETNIRDYSDLEPDRAIRDIQRRINVTFRNTTLFSIVAPRPLIRFEGAGCNPLCFRMVQRARGTYQYASYIGFGSLLVRTWFLGLGTASLIYIWNFIKSPGRAALQTVLFLNILFNFALHLVYGTDPLIYTPNWTYALVFFFGISFESLAGHKWWQIILLLFLAGLLVNNLGLFNTILKNLLPFFP